MQVYMGTKVIKAKPMTRLTYNALRGWTLPEDEDGSDEGYLVEYLDGGKANHPKYAGYISWSPKDVFKMAYRESGQLTFGMAVELARLGKRVARKGWNGSGMFAYVVPAQSFPAQTEAAKAHFGEDGIVPYRAYWALKTAQGDVATWTPSGSDTLAQDWYLLED